MAGKVMIAIVAVAAVLTLAVGVESPALGAPISLLVPQSTAFSVLGHSCGGIQEQAFATGFDAMSGYPTGDVHLSTRCGGSGRGGGYHTTTYSAWVGATWDLTGAPLPGDPGVIAQLKTSLGTCWGASFSRPTVKTATEFRAKSD